MTRIEVDIDSLPCPYCGRTRGYAFHQHRDRWKQTRQRPHSPRYATCFGCKAAVPLPGHGSPQWKDPNRCVRRAFAQAKGKTRARTAIQEANP